MKFFLLSLILMGLLIGGNSAFGVAEIDPLIVEIFSSTQSVFSVACGDFDAARPGDEMACLLQNGSVVALYLDHGQWKHSVIHTNALDIVAPPQHVLISVGNVIADHNGEEIVFNAKNRLVVISGSSATGWNSTTLLDFSDGIGSDWSSRVGDCDPTHSGDEIFFICETVMDCSLGYIFWETNGLWQSNIIYNAEVGMDAAIGDTNPTNIGNEIIIATEMGAAYELMRDGDGIWTKRQIWNDMTNAGWVVKIGDVDPTIEGNEVYYGTRYSDKIITSRYNGTNEHVRGTVLVGDHGAGNLSDISIGDAMAGEGPEIVGVNGDNWVYVVRWSDSGWITNTIQNVATSGDCLYAVTTCDMVPPTGDEIIAASKDGHVYWIWYPSFALYIGGESIPTVSWNAVTGMVYSVEECAGLTPDGSGWTQTAAYTITNQFADVLTHTNNEPVALKFFRVKGSY